MVTVFRLDHRALDQAESKFSFQPFGWVGTAT